MNSKASVFVYMVILLLAATEEHYCKGFMSGETINAIWTKYGKEIVDKTGDGFEIKHGMNAINHIKTNIAGLFVQGKVNKLLKMNRTYADLTNLQPSEMFVEPKPHVTDIQKKHAQAYQNTVKRSKLSIVNRSKRRCILYKETEPFGRRKRECVDLGYSGGGSGGSGGSGNNVITTAQVPTSISKATTSESSTPTTVLSILTTVSTTKSALPKIVSSTPNKVLFTPSTETSTPTIMSSTLPITLYTPSTESSTPTTESSTLTTLSSTPSTELSTPTTESSTPSKTSSVPSTEPSVSTTESSTATSLSPTPSTLSSTPTTVPFTSATVSSILTRESSTATTESSSTTSTSSTPSTVSYSVTTMPSVPTTDSSVPTTLASTLTFMSSTGSIVSSLKYLTSTITSSSSYKPVSTSLVPKANAKIPLVSNDPIQTEAIANYPATTKLTDQVTTLSAFSSGTSACITTKSSAIVPSSATLKTTGSISISLTQTVASPLSMQNKTTKRTSTYISNKQPISLRKTVPSVFSNILTTHFNSSKTMPTSTDVAAKMFLTSTATSIRSNPLTTVLPDTSSANNSVTVSKAVFTTASLLSVKSSLKSNTESVISSDVILRGIINVSYPVHETTLSKDITTSVYSSLASRASLSSTEEKLSTRIKKLKYISSKNNLISNVGSSHSEIVTSTFNTALTTTGDMIITGTLISVEIQSQTTPAAFNTNGNDIAKSGFFETASNVAIVSTVAVTTALVAGVLLIYSYMSQTGGAGQLWNSVSHGDEFRTNGNDRVSSTRQDRASPSSTTRLITGSSPPLTPIEVYDVTGLDF